MVFYICHCMSLHVCLRDFVLFGLAIWPIIVKKRPYWLSACSVLIVVP